MVNAPKIKSLREQKGISQESMASFLNVSQSTYARVESGSHKIEAGTLFKIAEKLEVPVADLLETEASFQLLNSSHDNSSFVQNFYSVQKELIDEYLKLFKEELGEMRKERERLFELLISKIS